MVHPLAVSDPLQDLDDVLALLGRLQDGDVPADDLVGGVAEDLLGAPVPARDDAIEGLGDDGIVGRFDDGREHLPEFLGPLPPGAAAEDAGDRRGLAGFALDVHLVAPLTAHRVVWRLRDRTRNERRSVWLLDMAARNPPSGCSFDASNCNLLHWAQNAHTQSRSG